MDTVFIHDLRLDTIIGAYDWERHVTQTLRLDLELGWDTRPAAQDDDLNQALDYAAVVERLGEFVGQSRFQLIETLAEHIAALLMEEFHIPWLQLTLSKPGAVRGARTVGVVIQRGERR